MAVLGVDIGKSKFFVCLLQEGDRQARHKTFTNSVSGFDDLKAWLDSYVEGRLHVCMEAAGPYAMGLAEYAAALGYDVSIVNPLRIRRYADSRLERIKTDKQDALVIALFCLREKPVLWTPRPAETKRLQELVRRYEDLKKLKVQETNRLKSSALPTVEASISKMVAFIEQEIEEIENAIREHISNTPAIKEKVDLLVTIPGISVVTARKLLAEIDFANFRSARAVAAFVGLTPALRQSGTALNARTRISKVGHPDVRHALYLPALVALRFNPILKTFADTLLQRGKAKMAVVCAVMRKLLHIAYGVLKGGKPFDPDYRGAL